MIKNYICGRDIDRLSLQDLRLTIKDATGVEDPRTLKKYILLLERFRIINQSGLLFEVNRQLLRRSNDDEASCQSKPEGERGGGRR
jgi:hypothetical protein